ncbi:MAG TPA: RidA family protein [Rhizomicrobium sp.]
MDFISSHGTKTAGLPFSDAVKVGDILYLSGQLGNLVGKLELAPGGIEGQTRQMMENIARILNANGRSFDDVFKCTVMLADMAQWASFNSVYVTYFRPHRLPARSAFGAKGLALGAAVEMECCAWAGGK